MEITFSFFLARGVEEATGVGVGVGVGAFVKFGEFAVQKFRSPLTYPGS